MAVEPVPGAPAAVADLPDGRALVVADYHAGLEVGLRYDGVELPSHADERRQAVVDLLDRTGVSHLVFLGDLAHAIGEAGDEERRELVSLFEAVTERVAVTVVKGNHDGRIAEFAEREGFDVSVTPGHGQRFGSVGFAHGHTWPAPDVLAADVLCVGHEHPKVRLEDDVGGARAERAWLRGPMAPSPFREYFDDDLEIEGELVVFPGFNDLLGGTWINVEGQGFLAPFLPDGLAEGQAYLLDGTRLGAYRRV
ncbi:MAG: metallophosphoesterase [Halorientalis sp.]